MTTTLDKKAQIEDWEQIKLIVDNIKYARGVQQANLLDRYGDLQLAYIEKYGERFNPLKRPSEVRG